VFVLYDCDLVVDVLDYGQVMVDEEIGEVFLLLKVF